MQLSLRISLIKGVPDPLLRRLEQHIKGERKKEKPKDQTEISWKRGILEIVAPPASKELKGAGPTHPKSLRNRYYSNVSREKRKKEAKDTLISSILEPESSSREYRKHLTMLNQQIYEMDLLTFAKCQGRIKIPRFYGPYLLYYAYLSPESLTFGLASK